MSSVVFCQLLHSSVYALCGLFIQADAVVEEVGAVVSGAGVEVAVAASAAGVAVVEAEEAVVEDSGAADDSVVTTTILCIVLSPFVVQEIAAFMT